MTSYWLDTAETIQTDPLGENPHHDVVVVGAGLTGLTTALLLRRAGLDVAVLEARHVGAVTTGNTTAKVSLLQGTKLSALRRHHGPKVARAYVEANREGQQWLLDYCRSAGVPVEHRTAYTYANGGSGVAHLQAELAATQEAGLETTWEDDLLELPYATRGAVALADQAQVHPMQVLAALTRDLRERGGLVHEGARVRDVSAGDPCEIVTDHGTVRAGTVILATGIPVLDRGLYFAKLEPLRSYCVAFEGVSDVPAGMYLSADSPSRSVRQVTRDGAGPLLVVGGSGHGVGRSRPTSEHVEELRAWTAQHFPGAVETHHWSAQDYASADGVPFVGALPRGRGRVHVATGFDKWGMTNGPAAALRLSAELLGGSMPWADTLRHRITTPSTLLQGARINAEVGLHAGIGWAKAAGVGADTSPPAEGEGRVGRRGAHPVATSTVQGRTCAVSAVCPHLKGIVRWNDAEQSWDCPLHGSRFGADGTVLEGPATRGLTRLDQE